MIKVHNEVNSKEGKQQARQPRWGYIDEVDP